ncbi:Coiled-coil domain-containing protein [Lasiodiplodia theobromae]|uniref:Coiled-coil domain-containing protein n=1 Tax=Lasiodiplodia theobromae TaxID=45133 RepID=A0A5N5CV56_9PEZI|nr:Coiled-coil domain-containing protein [Lasiodiplodia theobromae]
MQGFNMGRYYAPSTEHAPTFNTSSHPLGARARKLRSEGVLVVRFEMPFAVWCDTCAPPTIIGQGVRFNAEKKRVGAYHSTPIWEFALKHAACGGRIVVRTDPRRAEYVVESGGRRRDYGEARRVEEGAEEVEGEYYEGLLEGGERDILTPEERARRKGDAMAALEGRKGEKEKRAWEENRVEELRRLREKDWADPYAANKKLRKPFREQRKERQKEEGVKEELQDRFGLGLEIVDEREEDRQRAKLIDFGGDSTDGDVDAATLKAASRPLFGEDAPSNALSTQSTKGKTKAERAAEISKQALQQKLKGNTRAAMDPFSAEKTRIGPPTIAGLKRKRAVAMEDDAKDSVSRDTTPEEPPLRESKTPSEKRTLALVAYDSDDE